MSIISPQGTSFTKPELSPVSSQSPASAAAEAETIRRLRREVLGLTLTMDALKKNSKEWVFLNSKLQVAREELDAVLEDEQLFRSISSSAGSDKIMAFTIRNISEERREELRNMIPTPPLVASNTGIQELEDKLSQQVKYSLEWFETKKQIDAKTKKCEIISNVSVHPNNKKFTRSSTTGSIVTPRRREKLNKLPSMGTPDSERLRQTVMTSIKDGKNIQCLKDQLDRAPKYSLEWFELKRLISHGSNSRSKKGSKARTAQRRKSNDAEEMKENSSPEKEAKDAACDQSQHNTSEQQDLPSKKHSSYNRRRSEDANLEPPDGTDDHVISSSLISDSSSAPDPSLQSEPQEKAHNLSDTDLPSVAVHTSRTNNELDTDLAVAHDETEQDQKTNQNMQKLQEFLERVPKYSSEYYQTRKIIRLMQTNN